MSEFEFGIFAPHFARHGRWEMGEHIISLFPPRVLVVSYRLIGRLCLLRERERESMEIRARKRKRSTRAGNKCVPNEIKASSGRGGSVRHLFMKITQHAANTQPRWGTANRPLCREQTRFPPQPRGALERRTARLRGGVLSSRTKKSRGEK